MKINSKAGYTLLELLIYISIFAIAAGMLSGILITFTRIQSQEAASAEVTQQLSFVQTTIQRLVRESVNIQNQAGPAYASSTLILRMASSSLDPTIISSDSNGIYLKQGSGSTNPLTSDRVKVSQFQVVKYENPGGHAIVQVDLGLTYNSQRLYQQITRNLKTAIGRVTAATFDDNLLPNDCTITNQFSLGLSSCPWKTLSLSNLLNLGQLTTNPVDAQNGSIYYNTTDNVFRGYASSSWSNLGGGVGWAASSNDIYNTNSGNVGIGTANPASKLEIRTPSYTWLRITSDMGPPSGGIEFYGGASFMGGFLFDAALNRTSLYSLAGGYPAIIMSGNRDIIFQNASTSAEWMRLKDGNVGIGTTAPQALLHVGGGAETSLATYAGTLKVFTGAYNGPEAVGGIELPSTTSGYGAKLYTNNALDSFGIATRYGSATWIERLVVKLQTGNVGIGTATPGALLEVHNDTTTHGLRIQQDGNLLVNNHALYVYSNTAQTGAPLVKIHQDNSASVAYPFHLIQDGQNLAMYLQKTYNDANEVLNIFNAGTGPSIFDDSGAKLTAAGVWTDASSRTTKENFRQVDSFEVFNKINSLELVEYNYIEESDSIKHFGAVAEDWYATFGFGIDNKTISPKNVAMVALKGIQAIGERVSITSTGNVGIGRTPTTNKLEVEGDASKTTAGDWLANSDIRIKTDVQDIKNPLEVINQLRPVKFRYTKDYMTKHESIEDRYYYNFLAQEFKEVFPDSVKEDGEGYLQIDTYNVRPYLVAAIQELYGMVNGLKAENKALFQRIQALEAKLNAGQ